MFRQEYIKTNTYVICLKVTLKMDSFVLFILDFFPQMLIMLEKLSLVICCISIGVCILLFEIFRRKFSKIMISNIFSLLLFSIGSDSQP